MQKRSTKATASRLIQKTGLNEPVKLDKIKAEKEERIVTKSEELNRVLGGGIVPGSLVLIGGDPGIGKSTLMLQIMSDLSENIRCFTFREKNQLTKSNCGLTDWV